MRPDSEFQAGHLKFLCVGNRCRLMDARRTPGIIESVSPDGFFRWRISAFEDDGEYWDVQLEHVDRYQFALDSQELPPDRLKALEAQILSFKREIAILSQPQTRAETEDEISRAEASVLVWLAKNAASLPSQISVDSLPREEALAIGDCLIGYMESLGLGEQEQLTSRSFVLNPFSGEWIKGLEITFAELGLRDFVGAAPRTGSIFLGSGTKRLRRDYIVHRLAFVRATFKLLGCREVVLFRGMSTEGNWQTSSHRLFSSWTFSKDVAEAFATSARSKHSYLVKRTFPIEKLFLTCVETNAMNRQYQEQEAVVIHDGDDAKLW
jgi:hypothetical protein